MTDIDDDELDAFIKEDFSRPEKEEGLTAAEERIIAGFEDIQRFHAEHGRLPQAGTNRDIFERIYAVRLNALRQSAQCRAVLAEYDTQHWLTNVAPAAENPATMSDNELLAQLQDIIADDDLTTLKHVRSPEERQAAEYIANREPCANFAEYAPRFASVRQELQAGIRQARPFKKESGIRLQIEAGDYFILGGQIAYIAEAVEPRRRALSIGAVSTAFLAAGIVGQVVPQALANWAGWASAFLVSAAVLALCWAAIFVLVREPGRAPGLGLGARHASHVLHRDVHGARGAHGLARAFRLGAHVDPPMRASVHVRGTGRRPVGSQARGLRTGSRRISPGRLRARPRGAGFFQRRRPHSCKPRVRHGNCSSRSRHDHAFRRGKCAP